MALTQFFAMGILSVERDHEGEVVAAGVELNEDLMTMRGGVNLGRQVTVSSDVVGSRDTGEAVLCTIVAPKGNEGGILEAQEFAPINSETLLKLASFTVPRAHADLDNMPFGEFPPAPL